jgi:hypothetical protein
LGYHPNNVFVLNFFVLWAVLLALYLFIRSSLGELLAFAALILVVAQPLIALSATGGGFEMFNLLFMFISFAGLRYFLKRPGHTSFLFLLLSLIMLGNIRYESTLFFVIVMALLFAGRYIKAEFFARSTVYGLVPFLFLPWIWQRIILLGQSDPGFRKGTWLQEFQWDSVSHNVPLFFQYILSLDGHLGYAGVLNLIGIVVAVYFVLLFLVRPKTQWDKNRIVFWAACAGSIGVLLIGALLYHESIKAHPLNGRYYIPTLVVLSSLPVYFVAHFFKGRDRLAVPLLLAAAACFVYYHPVAAENKITNNLFIIREFRFVEDFLKKHAQPNVLVICDRPGQQIVSNYGAIHFRTANRDAKAILNHYNNRLINQIYVIQDVSYKTGQPLSAYTLNSKYELETMAETQINATYFLRISQARPASVIKTLQAGQTPLEARPSLLLTSVAMAVPSAQFCLKRKFSQ